MINALSNNIIMSCAHHLVKNVETRTLRIITAIAVVSIPLFKKGGEYFINETNCSRIRLMQWTFSLLTPAYLATAALLAMSPSENDQIASGGMVAILALAISILFVMIQKRKLDKAFARVDKTLDNLRETLSSDDALPETKSIVDKAKHKQEKESLLASSK